MAIFGNKCKYHFTYFQESVLPDVEWKLLESSPHQSPFMSEHDELEGIQDSSPEMGMK